MNPLIDFLLARIGEDEQVFRAAYPSGGRRVGKAFWGKRLAECEAKRRIVRSCQPDYEDALESGDDGTSLAEEVLTALALPYADHPDYHEEWPRSRRH